MILYAVANGCAHKVRVPDVGFEEKVPLKLAYLWPLHYDVVLPVSVSLEEESKFKDIEALFEMTPVAEVPTRWLDDLPDTVLSIERYFLMLLLLGVKVKEIRSRSKAQDSLPFRTILGTNKVAYAVATITQCTEYHSLEEFIADESAHCIGARTPDALSRAKAYARMFAWEVHDVILLAQPFAYRRPPGNIGFCYWKDRFSEDGADDDPTDCDGERSQTDLCHSLVKIARELHASSAALWEAAISKGATASKAKEWQAVADVSEKLRNLAAEAVAREIALEKRGRCIVEEYDLGVLKGFNDTVGFKNLMPPSFPCDPMWKERSLIEVFIACGVGVPNVFKILALERPATIDAESVMAWLYNAVEGADLVAEPSSARDADIRNVTRFLADIGAAERTQDGGGNLVAFKSAVAKYTKAEKYREVLNSLIVSLHEPDEALVAAEALINWHERVSTILCRCMLGVHIRDARKISRRMCFVRCPEVSGVSGWEDVSMGRLNEVCTESCVRMRQFPHEWPCSKIAQVGVVDSPFHLSMWLQQTYQMKLPDGQLLSPVWLMHNYQNGILREALRNYRMQHDESPALQHLVDIVFYKTGLGKAFLEMQRTQQELASIDKEANRFKGRQRKRKPTQSMSEEHAMREEVLQLAIPQRAVSELSREPTHAEPAVPPLQQSAGHERASFAADVGGPCRSGARWSSKQLQTWVMQLPQHTRVTCPKNGRWHVCPTCGRMDKHLASMEGSACPGFIPDPSIAAKFRKCITWCRKYGFSAESSAQRTNPSMIWLLEHQMDVIPTEVRFLSQAPPSVATAEGDAQVSPGMVATSVLSDRASTHLFSQ